MCRCLFASSMSYHGLNSHRFPVGWGGLCISRIIQGGSVPLINGVITPISFFSTPVAHFLGPLNRLWNNSIYNDRFGAHLVRIPVIARPDDHAKDKELILTPTTCDFWCFFILRLVASCGCSVFGFDLRSEKVILKACQQKSLYPGVSEDPRKPNMEI